MITIGNYAKLERHISKIKSNIRAKLRQDTDLMKFLLYEDDNPLSHEITEAQIDEMFMEIRSSDPLQLKRQKVFRTFAVRRSENEVGSILRVYTHSWKSITPFQFAVRIGVDVITHTSIDVIQNQNRSDIMSCLIGDDLSGLDVGVAAPLEAIQNVAVKFEEYNRNFIGVQLIFETTVAV